MAGFYKLIAVPHLLTKGEHKRHFETVTCTAESGQGDVHKWWCVNIGTFEADFSRIVTRRLRRRSSTVSASARLSNFPAAISSNGSAGSGAVRMTKPWIRLFPDQLSSLPE
jgi:hypothetical protein